MRDKISALMDGELDDQSAGELIRALARDAAAAEAWRTYHLISDAMRDSRLLSGGFTARVASRLAEEPTVLAPARTLAEKRKWFALSAAASAAAVALVGWVAIAPEQRVVPVQAPVAQVKPEAKPVIVPLPSAANDYLLAHQGFSPRASLQGMAPYVRAVSEQSEEPRR